MVTGTRNSERSASAFIPRALPAAKHSARHSEAEERSGLGPDNLPSTGMSWRVIGSQKKSLSLPPPSTPPSLQADDTLPSSLDGRPLFEQGSADHGLLPRINSLYPMRRAATDPQSTLLPSTAQQRAARRDRASARIPPIPRDAISERGTRTLRAAEPSPLMNTSVATSLVDEMLMKGRVARQAWRAEAVGRLPDAPRSL